MLWQSKDWDIAKLQAAFHETKRRVHELRYLSKRNDTLSCKRLCAIGHCTERLSFGSVAGMIESGV